ncbi:MAG: peptidoglycan-binding protein [Paracoccaceae bacterium]|nr:MAG: peptidoglycan-binding protein [Paracoccaceae bacterium]
MRALVVALMAMAGPAAAADRALVLANSNYADAADIAGAVAAIQAAPVLRAEGFVTLGATDQTAEGLRARLSELLGQIAPGDRVVIMVAGHFVQAAGQTWFLGTEASVPDVATVGAAGLSVAAILSVAAEVPGGAVVLLGTEARRISLGRGLTPGIGPLDIPQGVTVVQGDAVRVADFAARHLTRRGLSLPQMLAAAPELGAQGFLAPLPFRTDAVTAPAPVPAPLPPAQTEAERAEEDRQVAAARRAGTLAAWQDYITRWPAGRHLVEARAEVARINADPVARARAAEEALNLSRDQRRAVQRQLSLLGFDPRGIDGLFGPGSRAAITAWQRANAEAANGFLTRDQILRLTAQADRRAAELEAEAAARRAEQERQDRLFWDQTGARGDEAGLRAYLKRYPDGLFAELAQARLDGIEADRREQAAAQDRAAWDRARGADTVRAYREYLAAFPRGAFTAEAQARIEALQTPALSDADRARAEAAEQALNLGGLARNLIEQRLEALGFAPGQVDGTFDERTRRAIRRFQASRGLPETGYLDQTAMVGLLAGGVLQLGD